MKSERGAHRCTVAVFARTTGTSKNRMIKRQKVPELKCEQEAKSEDENTLVKFYCCIKLKLLLPSFPSIIISYSTGEIFQLITFFNKEIIWRKYKMLLPPKSCCEFCFGLQIDKGSHEYRPVWLQLYPLHGCERDC